MIALWNRTTPARGRRPVTGPIGAAAALVCLLGLAACGGGGGTGSAGPGPGDPGPAADPGYRFEENMAAVTSIKTLIDGLTIDMFGDNYSGPDRANIDETGYYPATHTTGSDAVANPPQVAVSPFNDPTDRTLLIRTPLGGNGYRFTETYMSGDTEYEGNIFLFWDPEPLGGEADALHIWGVWLRKQTASGTWDEMETFNDFDSGANEPHPVQGKENLQSHTGSATYTGAADGVYTRDGNSAGRFSAQTRLTANFGGNGDDSWTVTGTVDRFVLSGNRETGWSVTLADGKPRTLTAQGAPDTEHFYGTANGGGGAGVFGVEFYGPETALPSMILGEFKASFSDGTAVGAFNTLRDTGN